MILDILVSMVHNSNFEMLAKGETVGELGLSFL